MVLPAFAYTNREDGKDGTDDPRCFKIAHKEINNGKDEEMHQAALDSVGSSARGGPISTNFTSMTSF